VLKQRAANFEFSPTIMEISPSLALFIGQLPL